MVTTFAQIASHVPAKLLLVGDGPEMSVVSKLVCSLGIRDKVRFLGKQENLEELYSISDLMLLLSEKESFGLVALEGMACGVPCIGTNVGGIPEVITDGESGFVCELGDIVTIANKGIEILTNEPLHQKFSTNSIITAKTRFSAQQIVSQYEDIYQSLIKNGE